MRDDALRGIVIQSHSAFSRLTSFCFAIASPRVDFCWLTLCENAMDYYCSRSQKRRQRCRRTAVRHSLLASLQIRQCLDSVSNRLSLRAILNQYPLPSDGFVHGLRLTAHVIDECTLEAYERRSTNVSGGSTLFSEERPRVMIGELYNENDKPNTLTDQRQPTTLNPQSVTPLDDFSFLQGRVDPTARVEAQGPIDIGTHLGCLCTTNERPTTTHDTFCYLEVTYDRFHIFHWRQFGFHGKTC